MRTTSTPECQRAGAAVAETWIWCCLTIHLLPKNTVTQKRDLVLQQHVAASTKESKGNCLAAVSGPEQSAVAPAEDVESPPSGTSDKTAKCCFLQKLESLVAFQAEAWFWTEPQSVAACDGGNITISRFLDAATAICSCVHMPTHNSLFPTMTALKKTRVKMKARCRSCPTPLKRKPLKGCWYFTANGAEGFQHKPLFWVRLLRNG